MTRGLGRDSQDLGPFQIKAHCLLTCRDSRPTLIHGSRRVDLNLPVMGME